MDSSDSTPDAAESPASPGFPSPPCERANASESSTTQPSSPSRAPRIPSLRSVSDSETPSAGSMTASSTTLANLNAARRPGGPPTPSASALRSGGLPQDMQAKMKAFHLSRQGAPPAQSLRMPGVANGSGFPQNLPAGSGQVPGGALGGALSSQGMNGSGSPVVGPGGLRLPPMARPHAHKGASAPVITGSRGPKPGLGARRGLKLPGGLPGAPSPSDTPGDTTGGSTNGAPTTDSTQSAGGNSGSLFNKFSNFVDTKTGTLKFAGKAVIHSKGVDFSSGSSFNISLDEVDTLDELGKGNYGTVYKVRHSRPRVRRPGLGLRGNKAPPSLTSASSSPNIRPTDANEDELSQLPPNTPGRADTTGVVMAMKEIRLELDEAKFAAIIMELDILHRCISPFIVDFYGAFFQEGAVYICMEYMDGGSVDKLYADGIPEGVLRKIALSTVMGLKLLKDEHNIIHRDVKPTNILMNTRGQVKICDFGVSGNLVASIAKTNIGCQSYMAPERITSGGVVQAGANPGGGTYSVQSDIWSLGLTIIECAMGRYPYPPETYNNIFSQLSAIVDGEPPDLPQEGYSDAARDFVRGCLNKIPNLRPTYAMLLRHPWLAPLMQPPTSGEIDGETPTATSPQEPVTADEEVAQWVVSAIEKRKSGGKSKSAKPALHAAPLDSLPSPSRDSPSTTEVAAS